MPDKPTAIVGGDPTITRACLLQNAGFREKYLRSESAQAIEVPCQQCGRGILLAPSGQRLALDGGLVAPLDKEALGRNKVKRGGPSVSVEPCPAICMWCALAGTPALAQLEAAFARAQTALAKARGETDA